MTKKMLLAIACAIGPTVAEADPHSAAFGVTYFSGDGDYIDESGAKYGIEDVSGIAVGVEGYIGEGDISLYVSANRVDSEYTLAGTDYDEDASYTGTVGVAFDRLDVIAGDGSEVLLTLDRNDDQTSFVSLSYSAGLGNGLSVVGGLATLADSKLIDDYTGYRFGIEKAVSGSVALSLEYATADYDYKDSTAKVEDDSNWSVTLNYYMP